MKQVLEGRLISMEFYNPTSQKMEHKTIRMMSDRLRGAGFKPVFWSQLGLAYELYQRYGKGVVPPTFPDIVHAFLYMMQHDEMKGIAENLIELRDMTSTALIRVDKNKYRILHGVKVHLNLETERHEYAKDSNGNFTGKESFLVTTDIHTMALQTFLTHSSYDLLRAGLLRMNVQQAKQLGKYLAQFQASRDPRYKQQFIFHQSDSGIWRMGINKAGIACYDFLTECSGRGIELNPDTNVPYQRAVVVPVLHETNNISNSPYVRHVEQVAKSLTPVSKLEQFSQALTPLSSLESSATVPSPSGRENRASSSPLPTAVSPQVGEIRKLREEFQRERLLLEKQCRDAEEQYHTIAQKYQKLLKEKKETEKRLLETEQRYQRFAEEKKSLTARILEIERKKEDTGARYRQLREEKKAIERDYQKLCEQTKGSQAEIKRMQERLQEFEERYKELQQEKEELEALLVKVKERYQKSEERYQKSEERSQQLEAQKRELEEMLKKTREEYQHELSEQRRTLEEELKRSREEYFNDISKQKAELEAELKSSQEAYQSLLEVKKDLEEDYDRLRVKCQELEDFKKDLEVMSSRDRYLELLERYQEQEGHKKDLEEQLKRARDLYQQVVDEKKELEERLNQTAQGQPAPPVAQYDELTAMMGTVVGTLQELQNRMKGIKKK